MNAKVSKNQEEALKYHNIYRCKHLSGLLKWDSKLAQRAQNYANYLALNDFVKHDKKCDDGENIVTTKGANLNGKLVSNCWYNELKNYNYNNPGFNPKTGHFTQLIWKGSKIFGYGEARSKTGTIYAVGRYFPSGNINKEFADNVLPPLEKPMIMAIPPHMDGLTDDQFLVLQSHNIHRKNHGVEALIWSNNLLEIATNKTRTIKENQEISVNEKYGENSCVITSPNPDGSVVVEAWYTESMDYNYENPSNLHDTDHFTQIVWKSTTEIGYAKMELTEDHWILLVLYNPKGNIDGEYKNNVLSPIVKKEKTIDKSIELNEFQKQALAKHNEYRAIHNCQNLEWSYILEEEATKWADFLLENEFITKDPESKRGENIGYDWESENNTIDIIDKWYEQEKLYDYSNPHGTEDTSFFTQLVWSSTKYLGFASAVNTEGITVFVAKYWPPGNISGLYEENVPPKDEIKIPPPIITEEYKNWILKHHNILRKKHRSGKLSLSRTLCEEATNISQYILNIMCEKINFGNKITKAYKYNYLISKKRRFPNPKIVCQVWYNTCYYFRYDINKIHPNSAPFCEMVWKSTSEIGVGISNSDKNCVVVVIYDRPESPDSKVSKNIKRPLERFASLTCK
ncbi:hypothetical protein HZS_3331 [Henneguya salminicola]|nr:hypothetical protein HZS_3331 [Henneguya salminicola]